MTVEDNGHLDYQIGGWTLAEYVAEECEISEDVAETLVSMFSEGKEVPFIARYRRNMTDNLEAEIVHQAFNAYKIARELKKSAANIVIKLEGVSIENREKEIVIAKIKQARTMAELNALYAPYKAESIRDHAALAKKLGLESVALAILRGESVSITSFIDSTKKGIRDAGEVKKGAISIICEKIMQQTITQEFIRTSSQVRDSTSANMFLISTKSRKAQQMDKNHKDILRYQKHFNYRKPVTQVSDYEILAIKRGEQNGILFSKIEIDKGMSKKFYEFARKNFGHRFHIKHNDIFEETLTMCYKYSEETIRSSVMRILLDRAQRKSVECFARNLRHLLLTPPLKNVPIAAIDPGYANGCKVALISESGDVLFTGKFQLNGDRIQQKQHHAF
uniref:Tex-like protein N-terminal domain-containing protein n=1 Tax=Plectus sambesii TaxID=2011161 RepID=A0A914X3F0_9BILA